MDHQSIVAQLARAKTRGEHIDLDVSALPLSIDDSYDLQAEYMAQVAWPVRGWKVGATSKAGQEALQIEEPIAGPIFEPCMYASGETVKTPKNAMRVLEPEFAFLMARDLRPKEHEYSVPEVCAAIAGVAGAVEIVDSRFDRQFGVGIAWTIADGSANHAFIPGELQEDWRALDLQSQSTRLSINGDIVAEGNGGNVIGGPLNILCWLCNHLISRDLHLKAGDWVSTGLTTKVVAGNSGDLVVADFSNLGTVSIRLE
ncbi:fumarylacetoacetate hydrolase family protein [Sneathiella marina]|uniref:Fumarylacetoacetate hydrolase family protein n=1 Tax=Sneathiella marina TaxID=2950108 RepID=A0ABY4W1L7_9PROT|nr:fumarylacetoacetate hydrolase family protein [Sneathiella marina]USG61063.1 fumarylacetoacetate hydrolase family protein [Sneathiella marina]